MPPDYQSHAKRHFPAVTLEDLLPRVGLSQYRLVRLAMVRALEIHHGSPSLVAFHPAEKATTVALREIAQGRVTISLGTSAMSTNPTESQ